MADLEVVGYNPTTNRLEAPSPGNRYVLQQPLLLQSGLELTGQIVDHITRTAGTGAAGTTDTYTLYADAASTVILGTFQVRNGANGQRVDHTTRTAGNGAPGTTDTYSVWGDAAETVSLGTFTVANGANGTGAGDMLAATYDPASKAGQVEVVADKDVANGYAGTDANNEVVRPQAGAAAQAAAGNPGYVKRADGTWGTAGGAMGGTGNQVFYENDIHVTANYTITTGKNAVSAGPITVDAGVTVTVPTGSVWSIT